MALIFINRNSFLKFFLLLLGGITINNDNSNLRSATLTAIGHIIHKYVKDNIQLKQQFIDNNILENLFEILISLIKSEISNEVFRTIIKLLKVIYSTFNENTWINSVSIMINEILDYNELTKGNFRKLISKLIGVLYSVIKDKDMA